MKKETLEKIKEPDFCIKIGNLFSMYDKDEIKCEFEELILTCKDTISHSSVKSNIEYIMPTFRLLRKIPCDEAVHNYIYEYEFLPIYTNYANTLDPIIKELSCFLVDEIFGERVELNIYIFRKYGLPLGGFNITSDTVSLLYCNFSKSVSYKIKDYDMLNGIETIGLEDNDDDGGDDGYTV